MNFVIQFSNLRTRDPKLKTYFFWIFLLKNHFWERHGTDGVLRFISDWNLCILHVEKSYSKIQYCSRGVNVEFTFPFSGQLLFWNFVLYLLTKCSNFSFSLSMYSAASQSISILLLLHFTEMLQMDLKFFFPVYVCLPCVITLQQVVLLICFFIIDDVYNVLVCDDGPSCLCSLTLSSHFSTDLFLLTFYIRCEWISHTMYF